VTNLRVAATTAAFVAAGLAFYVVPALAIRPATHREAEAIQHDLGLDGCDWLVGISTRDTAWARIEADPVSCPAVGSLNTHARYDGGLWVGTPWTHDIERRCPSDAAIPEVVAGDLGLCVGPPPDPELLACDRHGTNTIVYRAKPRRCAIAARSRAYGHAVILRALRWRDWGSRVALAWGTEAFEPVAVRAWRLRRICGDATGARAYTRLRINSARGVTTVRRPPCR
jgi:hypothetical protein